MLHNIDDTEDIVQEIFVDIWKNAGRYDSRVASETTFIAMIARRRLIDRIRTVNRKITAASLDDIVVQQSDGRNLDPLIAIEAKEVAEVITTLRPEQQQVLYLSIVQGYSHQEIAAVTGMPLGTVKTHARRGMIEARNALGLGDEMNSSEAAA